MAASWTLSANKEEELGKPVRNRRTAMTGRESIPQEGCAVFRNWQRQKSTSVSKSVFPSSLASHDVS